MYVLVKSNAPARALLGDRVEFELVNGGWVVIRDTSKGVSHSVPLSNVQGVYVVER